ncbi:MAG: hypothetical protein H7A46_02155 [Verrucomicrobiales bacterium]|nr:hypothetical protein [Verrucomicrobiales bacterium]
MKSTIPAVLLLCSPAFGQVTLPPDQPEVLAVSSPLTFEQAADQALAAMTQRAGELNIQGVALVAFIEGDTTKSWSSKMVVVGKVANEPKGENRGSNLLAIAYTKAAEMAVTLKDSGHADRPPMTGETGWEGGLIRKGRNGYLLAAFSGGPSADDLKVSKAGLEVLAGKL